MGQELSFLETSVVSASILTSLAAPHSPPLVFENEKENHPQMSLAVSSPSSLQQVLFNEGAFQDQ